MQSRPLGNGSVFPFRTLQGSFLTQSLPIRHQSGAETEFFKGNVAMWGIFA
jgi:hypothetical protein